ncbi:hypothetical protein BJ165DRAFT_512390 [Panaeolus papilionaceus]|nr:hypothetical protein BJ165DRAFT_512390 [Panaeolus papilionaceus]
MFLSESCIKGHRSSSCHHTDRPLFEIKKKGRPVSQCTKCRELRQSKKLHSKCTCNHKAEPAQSSLTPSTSTGTKSRRFIPIVPALPNGLRDVLGGSNSSIHRPADARQRVDSLLNPCTCTSVWTCQCRQPSNLTASSSSSDNYSRPSQSSCSLDALAQAAAMQRSSSPTPTRSLSTGKKVPRSRPSSPTPQQASKRLKKIAVHTSPSPGPELAPILISSPAPDSTVKSFTMPTFDYMPPMSEISSLAGSGCTCGVECACPGCVEHRGSDDPSRERKNCEDGCGMCIDRSVEDTFIKMRQPLSGSSTSFLDQFFARAASLPSPPPHRQMSTLLDPMNTTVYTNNPLPLGVNLPKLECCGGRCSCPAGDCTCGGSCAGCCADEKERSKSPLLSRSRSLTKDIPPTPQAQQSCCS